MNHISFLKMSRVSLIGRRIMAEYRDEYGNLMLRYDEYGNPIPLVDEYGNPIPEQIPQSQTTTVPAAGVAVGQTEKEQHHRRSDSSSSSSSSEDDEQGGRRKKKSLKEKIKEKLPGGHKSEEHAHGEGGTATSTTTTHHEGEREGEGEGQGEGHHEKKGIMEKIKERLPGHH